MMPPLNKSTQPRILLRLALLLALAAPDSWAAPQGYLSDETTAPRSLEEMPSTFDDIDLLKETRAPGRFLPGIFGRYRPTEGWLPDASLAFKPRSYYRYRDEGNAQIREAFAVGGSLDFDSGWIADSFKIGLVGYTSQKLSGDPDRDGTGLLQPAQQGYTVLGQAYLKARYRNSTAHLFRQELNLPFLNRSDSRMTPKTFEAYLLSSEAPLDIDGLTLGGGHVTKMKDRTDTRFSPLSHQAGVPGAERGVTVVGARYQLGDHAWLGATDHYGWDLWNTFYTESALDLPINDRGLSGKIALQFSDQRSVGDELAGVFDTRMFGTSLGLGWRGLVTTLAFTTTAEGSSIRNPWGGHPSFNSVMLSDFDRPGEESYRLGVSYDFSGIGLTGLSAFANLVRGTDASGLPDQDEWNATVDYRRESGPLKNLWLRVRAGQNHRDGGATRDEIRVILNYSCSF